MQRWIDWTTKGFLSKRGHAKAYIEAKTPEGTYTIPSPLARNPVGGAFERCVKEVAARGSAYDPRAVCATAGVRKYGQAEMTRRSVAGRKRAARRRGNAARVTQREVDSAAGTYHNMMMAYGENNMATQRAEWAYRDLQRRYAEQKAKRAARSPRGRRLRAELGMGNPAEAAAAVTEEFHGRPVKEWIPVKERRHYHKYLSKLGDLRKLVIRKGLRKVTAENFEGALLCANEEKNQLFIKDGNQSVNLRDFGVKDPHEVEDLGDLRRIDYYTNKHHLGDQGGPAVYFHNFSRPYPTVRYYTRDERLEISGGNYRITGEGIVG